MLKYIQRRLLLAIPQLLGVTLIIFLLVRLLPGDPATAMAGPIATEEYVEMIRERYALDEPMYRQYYAFMRNLFRGDLGTSVRTGQPVTSEIMSRLPVTLTLALASMAFACIFGIGIGILSAVKQGTILDDLGRVIALLGISMPVFWSGAILIVIFSVYLGWLPAFGTGSISHWILPSITLGAYQTAVIMRMERSSMLEVIGKDYIKAARARGLGKKAVILKHALKNSLIPVITLVGLQLGILFTGTVLTETVFGMEGVGRLLVDSIARRDYPVVQGVIIFSAFLFVILNLIVDILYTYIDPRIRYD